MVSNTISVNDGLYKIAVGKYARDFTVIDNKFTNIMDVSYNYLKSKNSLCTNVSHVICMYNIN